LQDTKIISKPPYMDCIAREMIEIELHPNHMNRGLLRLEQIIETSHSLLRKWRKPPMIIHQPFSGPQTSSLPFIFWDNTGSLPILITSSLSQGQKLHNSPFLDHMYPWSFLFLLPIHLPYSCCEVCHRPPSLSSCLHIPLS
jgi:hypothetical protein